MSINTINNKTNLKLDKIDKKLFFYLSENIRMPKKDLAKKLNISQERLNYRIDRFFSNIIEPVVLINFPLLGVSSYVLFLKDQLKDFEILRIEKAPETCLFTQCVGEYRHILHIITNDLDVFMKKYLKDLVVEEIHQIRKYLPDNYNGFKIENFNFREKLDKKINLKKNYLLVLKELIKNPILSQLKISLNTKIDRRQVKKIIEDLDNNNYVQKFRFILNSYKIGFQTYFLKVYYNYDVKDKLLEELRDDFFSGFIYLSDGFLYMWYLPKSEDELFNFINKIELKFSFVKINSVHSTNLYVLNFMPSFILKYLDDQIESFNC